ncbi:MAG: hypothetical protein HY454_00845 [Parcubacteria group bacterium]|nr:hypothetical protein [Parcubacteria group bacterium]
MADGDQRYTASLVADIYRSVKWFFFVPVAAFLSLMLVLATLAVFGRLWPNSWLPSLPINAHLVSAEVVEEPSALYHDDDKGLVQISYGNQRQKYDAIQKWHDDFPDRWNRQIWEDSEEGVLLIAYVP